MDYTKKAKLFLRRKTPISSTIISVDSIISDLDAAFNPPIESLISIVNEVVPEENWEDMVNLIKIKQLANLGHAIIGRKKAGEKSSNVQQLIQENLRLQAEVNHLKLENQQLSEKLDNQNQELMKVYDILLDYSNVNGGEAVKKVKQSLESDDSIIRRIERLVRSLMVDLFSSRSQNPESDDSSTNLPSYQFIETEYDEKLKEIESAIYKLNENAPQTQKLAKETLSLSFHMNEFARQNQSIANETQKLKDELEKENQKMKDSINSILQDEATADVDENLKKIQMKIDDLVKENEFLRNKCQNQDLNPNHDLESSSKEISNLFNSKQRSKELSNAKQSSDEISNTKQSSLRKIFSDYRPHLIEFSIIIFALFFFLYDRKIQEVH